MLVTLLRHGQSEHNAGLTSFLDSGLTPLGHQQAIATAERFQSEGFTSENTIAFVSPLVRTLQTVEPTAALLGLHTEVFADVCEYFSIRNDGYKQFQGLSKNAIRDQFPFATLGSHIVLETNWWPQKQEDDQELYDRVSTVRDKLLATYLHTGKNLLIVSHADPIGRLVEAFLRVNPNMSGPPWSGNCGVTRLSVETTTEPAKLLLLSDMSHLTRLSLETPT